MKCDAALAILQTVNDGAEARIGSTAVREMVSGGFLAPAPAAPDGPELERVRRQLAEVSLGKGNALAEMGELESRYPGVPPSKVAARNPEHAAARRKFEGLEAEERRLRTEFLDRLHRQAGAGVGASLNGERVSLTYRGRELLGELSERFGRVAQMELADFIDELEALKRHFAGMAARSRAILRSVSPAFPDVEEIHLRMAAVGLAARPGDPAEAASLFLQAYRQVRDLQVAGPAGVMLAETVVVRSRSAADLGGMLGSFRTLLALPSNPTTDFDERVRSLAMVLAAGGDMEDLARQAWGMAASLCPENPSAAAFLAATGPAAGAPDARLQSFQTLRSWTAELGAEPAAAAMASAMMAAGPYPPEAAWERFRRTLEALSRFNGGGMEAPAAMLAVLPQGVEENLDNLRLASAAIVSNRLSLGGAENLSLGIKLLMESSLMAASTPGAGGAGPPSVLAVAGVSPVASAPFGVGLAAFHETSVHRAAWRDYRFHPVHHHYIYG